MDFLLECIGFPPDHDLDDLAGRVLEEGEAMPWRGSRGVYRRLPLTGGLEVQLDHGEGEEEPTLWPHFRVERRLRIEVQHLTPLPDSPFDVLLSGRANPPLPGDPNGEAEAYPISTYLVDRRRLPPKLPLGHVLAVRIAGFALDVQYIGPNEGGRDPSVVERPRGAWFRPLGEEGAPGGCMEVSTRVREVKHLVNPITLVPVEVLEVDAPGRPLQLFLSRWQLETDRLPAPRPGWRVEGCFLFTGRTAGGLPPARPRKARAFG